MSKLLKIISNTTLVGILGLGFFIGSSRNEKETSKYNKYILSDGRTLNNKEVFDFYESVKDGKKAKVYRIEMKNDDGYISTTKYIHDFGNGDVKEYNSIFISPKN